MVETEVVGEIEFVNREQELGFLTKLLPPASTKSSLVILRSPAGFGKSRLTDELVRRTRTGLLIAVVDPLIRSGPGSPRIYDGFFVQRVVAQLSSAIASGGPSEHTFERYLGRRRWKNIRERSVAGDLQTLPGARSAYSAAVQYLERFFAIGRFSPKELLNGETRDAVSVCVDYLKIVSGLRPLLLVIREAQHTDHESLRTILQINARSQNHHLILEYTSPTGHFDADHEKLLQRELIGHPNAHLLDLVRLGRGHLEYLLRRVAPGNLELNSEFYGRWDGNLRLLGELQYRASIGRRLLGEDDVRRAPSALNDQIREHIDELTGGQRWLLAIVAAHIEPLHRRVLLEAALSNARNTTERRLAGDLETLSKRHAFVVLSGDQVSLSHEDLAIAVREAPGLSGLIVLAEKALRDCYVRIVRERDFAVASLAIATRRAFAFCARSRDIQLLVRLIDDLDAQVRAANDYGTYIDIGIEAVLGSADLLPGEKVRMIDWAATLAYEINDFRSTIKLLDQLPKRNEFEAAMLAFSVTETGAHERALSIAQDMAGTGTTATFVADLIVASDALDRGAWDECRVRLKRVIELGKTKMNPLVGHALRLLAEIEEYPKCTALAVESITYYRSLGLLRCTAYSELSASRFLARTGHNEEAARMVDSATAVLSDGPANRHILFNNRALVGMLSAAPDYERCVEWLSEAMRTSRDDFADLTILTNLAVAEWKSGDYSQALECVARCDPILDNPEFSERDVFWPVCFNLAQVLNASGEQDKARRMLERPRLSGWTNRTNGTYWAYRLGESDTPDPNLAFLHRFDYHPVALSQWQLDLEVLEVLTQGSPR